MASSCATRCRPPSRPPPSVAIADELIRALVALHAVDYNAIGLGNLGKPEGYIARQIKRWIGQLDGARTRDIPDLDDVSEWLQRHMPASPPATIVHGDFRLDNAMYAPQPPAKILAVLDWEMSTLGDPLADLGYLLSFWRERGEPQATPLPDDMGDVTSLPGFPPRADVAARYEELSGRKVTHLTFYIVLAIWKLAILLEGSYKRHQLGPADDPFFALLGEGVPALAKRARADASQPMTTTPSPYLRRREGVCEIYLIRHGDAEPEEDNCVPGRSYDEQPLSRLGRHQAEALARFLRPVEFAAIYSSPLVRCLETAGPLADAQGLSVVPLEGCREIMHTADARFADEMSPAEFIQAFREGGMRIGAHAMQHGTFDGLPGAEPRAQFRARVREAIDAAANQHPYQRIAVFSHGGAINVYCAAVLGLERDFFFPIANIAISIVRVHGARRMIVALNSICHLREMVDR